MDVIDSGAERAEVADPEGERAARKKKETSKLPAPALMALELAASWAVAAHFLTQNFMFSGIPMDINFGARTFFLLGALAALILVAKYATSRPSSESPKKLTVTVVSATALCVAGLFIAQHMVAFAVDYNGAARSDLTVNVWTAARNNFDLKENPYTTDCQLWHDPSNKPHVTKVGHQLYMFGVPYDFGFAYFPAMFMTYEPFRHIDSTYKCVRLANGVFYLLTLGAIGWLTALFVPPGFKVAGAILSVASFACNLYLGWEYFFLGTADIVIPMFALFGFIAAYYKRPVLAGIFFGWAFACKLLPGGFFCLIMGAWYWRRPERWKFWIPGLATFILVVVPYVLKNPPAFLSATILYYLTEHANGDMSALYATVPDSLKTLFLVGGYSLVVVLLWVAMRRHQTLLGALASSFVIFATFMAFSKLAHDNYYFAVAPLGSVALVAYALRNARPDLNPGQRILALKGEQAA